MGCDVKLALEIEAGAETVFDAITTQEGEAAFWTSDNETEPKEGSVAVFRFPGAPVPARMRVDELQPGRRVLWSCLGDFPGWQGTEVSWDLQENEAKTHLMFKHTGFGDDYPEHDLASITWVWAMVLGRLKGYAETGSSQPFFG